MLWPVSLRSGGEIKVASSVCGVYHGVIAVIHIGILLVQRKTHVFLYIYILYIRPTFRQQESRIRWSKWITQVTVALYTSIYISPDNLLPQLSSPLTALKCAVILLQVLADKYSTANTKYHRNIRRIPKSAIVIISEY